MSSKLKKRGVDHEVFIDEKLISAWKSAGESC
jgi:hypothetical protein